MRKFQIIIDVDVTDDKLTEKSIVSRWKKSEQLLPGVQVTSAVGVPVYIPVAEGLNRSLADVEGVPARLINCCRNANIHTLAELAAELTEVHRFRGMGPGTVKQAIAVCLAHGAQVNPDLFDLSNRAYILELQGRKTNTPQ